MSIPGHSPTRNNKPLEEWTKEEVQEWLQKCDYREYASSIPLNGRQLARRTKEDFVTTFGRMAGSSLFDDIQDLKTPQQGKARVVSAEEEEDNALPHQLGLLSLTPRPRSALREGVSPEGGTPLAVKFSRMELQLREVVNTLRTSHPADTPTTTREVYTNLIKAHQVHNNCPLWFGPAAASLDREKIMEARQEKEAAGDGTDEDEEIEREKDDEDEKEDYVVDQINYDDSEQEEEDEDEVATPRRPDSRRLRQEFVKLLAEQVPSEDGSESRVVQPWWTERLKWSHKIRDTKLVARDTHGQQTLDNLKPDTAIYIRGLAYSPFNLVAVGENKPGRSGDCFTDQEKGQMINYLRKLITTQESREQSRRASATGYLSDGRIIQFFRLDVHSTDPQGRHQLDLYESAVLLLASNKESYEENGALAFLALLDSTPEELGYRVPEVYVSGRKVVLKDLLGSGSSAVVYAGHFNRAPVVVKRFREPQQERLNKERNALKKMKELIGRVPKVEAVSDDWRCLILTPIGKPFARRCRERTAAEKESLKKIASNSSAAAVASAKHSNDDSEAISPTSEHFKSIIDTLVAAHKKGILHCDMTLSNCFHLSMDGRVAALVNDWGHSKVLPRIAKRSKREVMKSAQFIYYGEGTLHNASLSVLRQLTDARGTWKDATVKVCPADDLCSVVCMVFHAMATAIYESIHDQFEPAVLLQFWEKYLHLQPWKNMAEAAAAYNHERLKELIDEVVPSHDIDTTPCTY